MSTGGGIVPQIPLGTSFGTNMNMGIQDVPAPNVSTTETNDIMAMIRDYAEKEP